MVVSISPFGLGILSSLVAVLSERFRESDDSGMIFGPEITEFGDGVMDLIESDSTCWASANETQKLKH